MFETKLFEGYLKLYFEIYLETLYITYLVSGALVESLVKLDSEALICFHSVPLLADD